MRIEIFESGMQTVLIGVEGRQNTGKNGCEDKIQDASDVR